MKSYMYLGHVVSWKDNPKEIIDWIKKNKEYIPKVIISIDLSDWLIYLLPEILDEDCEVKLTDTLDNEEAFIIYQKIEEVKEIDDEIDWDEMEKRIEDLKPKVWESDDGFGKPLILNIPYYMDEVEEKHERLTDKLADELRKEVNFSNFVTKNAGGEK